MLDARPCGVLLLPVAKHRACAGELQELDGLRHARSTPLMLGYTKII